MAKAIKYKNEFSGVSASSITNATKAISDFVASLNAVDYSSSGCFAMSTNAKYDATFNNGIEYLKGKDIVSMVTLCNSCSTVLSSIQTYLSKYSEYETAYNTYSAEYDKYNSSVAAYTEWKKNGEKGTKPTVLSEPSDADINQKVKDLETLAKKINSVSF